MNGPTKPRSVDDNYNVNTYTDAELYDILDVINPTDRELEARIIFLMHKYDNMQNADATKLSNFFENKISVLISDLPCPLVYVAGI